MNQENSRFEGLQDSIGVAPTLHTFFASRRFSRYVFTFRQRGLFPSEAAVRNLAIICDMIYLLPIWFTPGSEKCPPLMSFCGVPSLLRNAVSAKSLYLGYWYLFVRTRNARESSLSACEVCTFLSELPQWCARRFRLHIHRSQPAQQVRHISGAWKTLQFGYASGQHVSDFRIGHQAGPDR